MPVTIRHKAELKYQFQCLSCAGTGAIPVYNVCGVCDGDGCSHCHKGLIRASIPCQNPDCKVPKRNNRGAPRKTKRGKF